MSSLARRGLRVGGEPLVPSASGVAKTLLLALLTLLGPSWSGANPGPPVPVVEQPAPENLPDDRSPWPVRAEYVAPTDCYPHGILGLVQGWGGLVVDLRLCPTCGADRAQVGIHLPEARVLEDLAPRLWDVTGDGRPEVVVIESDAGLGARLAIWEARETDGGPALGLRAATPFIGTRFRWLAPLGAADFTGDGVAEIAYVETPHLGRTLRLVTLEGDRLVEIALLEGVTNHAIGEEHIDGGIRVCDGRPEIIARSGDRTQVLAIRFEEGALISRVLGPSGEESIDGALACAP